MTAQEIVNLGYMIVMTPVISVAVGLPLVWWRPGIFGPLFGWLLITGGVVGVFVMTMARTWGS